MFLNFEFFLFLKEVFVWLAKNFFKALSSTHLKICRAVSNSVSNYLALSPSTLQHRLKIYNAVSNSVVNSLTLSPTAFEIL
jgi:hypothetical protein